MCMAMTFKNSKESTCIVRQIRQNLNESSSHSGVKFMNDLLLVNIYEYIINMLTTGIKSNILQINPRVSLDHTKDYYTNLQSVR